MGCDSVFRLRTMRSRWELHPAKSTAENVANIKRQINEIAALYDWDMEVNTTDPNFYKWTQWIFVKMFKEGLAYEKEFPINWCPSCKTGLANEEVVNGNVSVAEQMLQRKICVSGCCVSQNMQTVF